MMQQAMDVSSLLRQMQMNMMMPSLLPVGMPATMPSMMQDQTGPGLPVPLQSSSVVQRPAVQSTAGPVLPVPLQSQSVVPQPRGAPLDQGGPSHPEDHQHMLVSSLDQGGSSGDRRGRRRERRRDSRSSRSRSRSRSRSFRRHRHRRSSRHHRSDARRSHGSRLSSSEGGLDVDSIRLNATHYLTRDYAKCDNIPSNCLMIWKLPRVQLSALIESMHEPWNAAVTSNLSVAGLCQLLYLMTLTIQPWTRIADLRVEFKYKKLLKRCVNAFNAVKMEQTHWNPVCTMIGNGVALLTEDSLNSCALMLGWQPTWMTETQNNRNRVIVPATEHGSMRAFVRPMNNNSEASGIPVPQFRMHQGGSSNAMQNSGVSEGRASSLSPPPVRIRRRIIPPGAIVRANQAMVAPGAVNVEQAEPPPPAAVAPAAVDAVEVPVVAVEAPTVDAAPAVVVEAPMVDAAPAVEAPMVDPVPAVDAAPAIDAAPAVVEAPMADMPAAVEENAVAEAPVAEVPVEAPAVVAPPGPGDEEFEPIPPLEENFVPRRVQNVELCSFCLCPNVEDREHGPLVKLNCPHSFHRHCLQEWMDSGDLPFEQACPMRCHLGLQ